MKEEYGEQILLNKITVLLPELRRFAWCVGSQPGYCDIKHLTETTDTSVDVMDLDILDGHFFVATIKVSKKYLLEHIVSAFVATTILFVTNISVVNKKHFLWTYK